MSNTPSIMSIRELIDTAFGDEHVNVVNHKLIHTILIIMARQLRLLERRVKVEIGPLYDVASATSISVTELKIHANVPRKRKLKQAVVDSKHMPTPKTGMYDESLIKHGKPAMTKPTTVKSLASSKTGGTPLNSIFESPTEKSTDQSLSFTKSSSNKTTADKSTEKSSDKTEKSTVKSSDITKKSTKKSSNKTSTDEPLSTKDFIATTSTEKSSSAATSSHKTTPGKSTTGEGYIDRLEEIEEKREKELRVIHQRANSREYQDKTPTPMASLDSMEKQYEKLLVVERVPTEEARPVDSRSHTEPRSKAPRLSVVTQEEFEELTKAVRNLQKQFTPGFPDNAQLLDDLRRGASLTDAMAALQLSARIEAAEKALEKMLSLVTDLASSTPGINLQEMVEMPTEMDIKIIRKDTLKETEAIHDADATSSIVSKKSTFSKSAQKSRKSFAKRLSKDSVSRLSQDELNKSEMEPNPNWITTDELDVAMEELYDEFVKMVNTATTRSNTNANNALKIATKLESKLDESLNLGDRMNDLEKIVSEYADQINALDTGLSSQMTNYQEQLTQMEHELEAGIETMQEALANTGGDTAAVAELNNNFTNLQMDFDVALMSQKDLRDIQDALAMDLQALWKQIELLRDSKSDRDEVADALRDKAGLAALNGLVSRQEFDAVRGDFEKRIGSAYDKFNNQETVWQKAIDEILRELSEKADWIQVVSLQDSIKGYLEKFQSRINAMMEIVGEPRAAAITRKLHREAACLSCSTPAQMELESTTKKMLPVFPSSRPPAIGAEVKVKPSNDGDHRGVCYPDLPVPHPIDPRSHICRRYCGGSHTALNNVTSRVPFGMIINPALRQVNTAVGSDGKSYMVDDTKTKKPCIPCNYLPKESPLPKEYPVPQEPEPARLEYLERKSSEMTPSDYREASLQFIETQGDSDGSISATPPIMDD